MKRRINKLYGVLSTRPLAEVFHFANHFSAEAFRHQGEVVDIWTRLFHLDTVGQHMLELRMEVTLLPQLQPPRD